MVAAKYPAALVALADFRGELPNFPEATLSGAHTAAVTTITLTATVPTAWPASGAVTIDSEIITYTGKSGATLTGATRGADGTTAATHADAAKVGAYLTAATVNQIFAEVIAIETQVGSGGTIASAATTDLSTVGAGYIQVTGTTTITAFGTLPRGVYKILEFAGALTLMHNATNLILRTGANVTTSAGDVFIFASEGAGNWREIARLTTASAAGGLSGGQMAHATITADITTVSTTFVDATGLSVTITTTGGDVLIWFSGAVSIGVAAEIDVTLAVDGTAQGGTRGLAWTNFSSGGNPVTIGFVWRVAAPSAASHTYKIQWKSPGGGTATMNGNPNATIVVEERPH